MKRVLLIKPVPKWVVFGFTPIVLALVIVIFEVVSSFFLANNQMAHLSVISGVVKLSDGITEVTAVSGNLNIRNMRTLLKTGQGMADLTFWDGTVVIVDSDSTIEINRQTETDSGKSFAFNLVEGKALVVNGDSSQTPTQIIIGGAITVQIFRGAVGIEVIPGVEIRESVDCLAGQCLVNGVYHLITGQNAQIGPDNTIQITESVSYTRWISLMLASKPTLVLSNLIAILSTASASDPKGGVSSPADSKLTSSPGFTRTPTPEETPTLTSTNTQAPSASPGPSAVFTITVSSPTATQTPSTSPSAWFTPTPSKTLTRIATQLPTFIILPQPTPTKTYTHTPLPTPTKTYTHTPLPTPTKTYTHTPLPTPTKTYTHTPLPTPTITDTYTPQPTPTTTDTHTPLPTPTITDTYTPQPTPTPIPTLVPSPTDTPQPAFTPIPTLEPSLIPDPR